MALKNLSDIEKLRIGMDSKFVDINEKLMDNDLKFEKIDNKLDLVLNQLNSIAGQFKKFDEERVLMSDKLREHTDQIDNLQKIVYSN